MVNASFPDILKRLPKHRGEPRIFWSSFIFSLKCRELEHSGYCAPWIQDLRARPVKSCRIQYQCSENALDGHEDHGAGALLGDLAGSVSDGVLRLQRVQEDRGEVVHLGHARLPTTNGLQEKENIFKRL